MTEQPAPDAGNTEDLDTLTEPLDEGDDVYCRVAVARPVEPAPADPQPTDDDPQPRP